jgi:hypothetical protein
MPKLLASRSLRNQVKPVFMLKLTMEEENGSVTVGGGGGGGGVGGGGACLTRETAGKLTSRHLEASATELRHVCK